MITRLTIEHFKSLERIDVSLSPLSVFVGPNASGKSNLIDAVRFVRDAVHYDLDRAVSDRHGIDSIRQWSRFKPYNTTISLNVAGNRNGRGHFTLTLGSSKGNYRILREEGSWTEPLRNSAEMDSHQGRLVEFAKPTHTHSILYNRSRGHETVRLAYSRDCGSTKTVNVPFKETDNLFIAFARVPLRSLSADAGVSFRRLGDFASLRRELYDFEAYSIFPNTLRTPQKPSNERRLNSIGDNLTSVFKVLQRSRLGLECKTEILSALKLVMPNLENIVVQSLGGLMVPLFRVRERDGKLHDFNVSQISDGTLRIFGLLTALYQPFRPSIIALEEPEQTVNPGVLAVLAEAAKEIATTSQILLTTYSPNFLDYFDAENIFSVGNDGGVTRIGPISSFQKDVVKQRLLTLGELMTAEGIISE